MGPLAALFAGNPAGVDELPHVVRDRRLSQPDRVGEVADAGLAAFVAAIIDSRRTRVGSPRALNR
jgi:hypothetical protein